MCLEGTTIPRAFFAINGALALSSDKQGILVFAGDTSQLPGGTVKLYGRDLLALNQGVACFAKHDVLSSMW
jgi:hypothetical protein